MRGSDSYKNVELWFCSTLELIGNQEQNAMDEFTLGGFGSYQLRTRAATLIEKRSIGSFCYLSQSFSKSLSIQKGFMAFIPLM